MKQHHPPVPVHARETGEAPRGSADFSDNRPAAVAQRALIDLTAASPRPALQRQSAGRVETAQRANMDETEAQLQAKFDGIGHGAEFTGARPLQLRSADALSAPAQPSVAWQSAAGSTGVVQRLTATYKTAKAPTVIRDGATVKSNVVESDGVDATVAPADYDTGSVTNEGVRATSQQASAGFEVSFIAGHMLNKHLGGPGNDQKNITAISSRQNSQHHAQLEKAAKAAVRANKTITYKTHITERATFTKGSVVAQNLASWMQGEALEGSTSIAKIDMALGPPNATKTGGTAAAPAYDKVEEGYHNVTKSLVGMLEPDLAAKYKFSIDISALTHFVYAWVSRNQSTDSIVKEVHAQIKANNKDPADWKQ